MFAPNYKTKYEQRSLKNIEGEIPTTDIRYRTPVQAVNAPATSCLKWKSTGKAIPFFIAHTSKQNDKMTSIARKMYSKAQYLYITPLFFIPYYFYILHLWSKTTPLTAMEYLCGAFMYLAAPIAIEWVIRHHISSYRKNSKK